MIEEIIDFETAKLAQSKGCDVTASIGDSHRIYDYRGNLTSIHFCQQPNYVSADIPIYIAPTLALLQQWLREVHRIHIAILPKTTPSNTVVYYSYKGTVKTDWKMCKERYEEALAEQIKESLMKLETVVEID